MSKSYSVVGPREFTYPANPISLAAIKNAGGISQMTEEQKSKLKFKTVREGGDCSDMPEPARSIYLERGWITEKGSTVADAEVKS